ncbi:ExbD/TolR family protein [Shimia sp. MMG029]|uniref:ExbD/TolR family protein n=1 Tax=Shimia sp. MMG029 TaxID=3021978 RepID=UPI0022FDC1BD|nr:biopolymer transporter ExbD [Shimia sp. MMG029]MDA5558781.1 biopolymer transporter ExbD [Shimia sp. MMG029]
MMDFAPEPRRQRAESIVPMINVVFLLLIFFLMTAKLSQPDPFEVTPPVVAQGAPPQDDTALYVGKDDQLQFRDTKGEAVFESLALISKTHPTLQVRIDAALDGDVLARVMARLATSGFRNIEVVVEVK